MFRWLTKNEKKNPSNLQSVVDGLKKLYKKKLRPLEEEYLFNEFHSPLMSDADFTAKPMVLLVGQYSTGKTTFIKYLLEQEFPGLRIGPEPTTDSFIAVMHGEHDQVVPGNALIVDPSKQFQSLGVFGNAFLNRLYCSELRNKVLETITIIDTPGILSGEKQSVSRGYDFIAVLKWFAERVDRIILLFDAHKLDISDEFQRSIEVLREYDEKIRIVLNKADMVTAQQLMRVHGALMWSLGKVLNTPEVARVYIGSFWDQPLQNDDNRKLFEAEAEDLFADIQSLPRNATLRKLNDFIKRARLAKVHAFIISSLRRQMPSVFGKEKKKKKLIDNLEELYRKIQTEHNISAGDFPPISTFQSKLQPYDFSKLRGLKPKLLNGVDKMLQNDVTKLMSMIPEENKSSMSVSVRGGAFSVGNSVHNPFASGAGEGIHFGAGSDDWIIAQDKDKYDRIFETLSPDSNGKVSSSNARREFLKSKLPNTVMRRIWDLSDLDKDGMLDSDEFAVAMHLINIKLEGNELPDELPIHVVPPSKRREYSSEYDSDDMY